MADIMKMGKNPNFLGSWDLMDVPELTLTIKAIRDEDVVGERGKETCTVCHFSENVKPMILNITNKKRICKLYKTKDSEKLVGKRITIITENIKAFGAYHDALRVKQQIPVEEKPIACEVCGNSIKAFGGMTIAQTASYTKAKVGKVVCSDCAKKMKEEENNG